MTQRNAQTLADLNAKYVIGEQLGTGAFSEVKKAVVRATGEEVAIKIIDRVKCKGKENMIQSEVEILKKVQHENIISLYELYESERQIFLVMQLVTGGELFDSIVERGHYTETDAAKIVLQILKAVDYLHEQGIAHRDLKPENLLFSDASAHPRVMISDFGLSKIFNDAEHMKTACGTPGYVAPEVLRRQGYGRAVDLWSIGVIAYILLSGYPPFYEENDVELFTQIMRGQYEFDSPYWDNISVEAKDFIRHMLVVNPTQRMTTSQALQHPFIVNNLVPDEPNMECDNNLSSVPMETASVIPSHAMKNSGEGSASNEMSPSIETEIREACAPVPVPNHRAARTESEKSNLAPQVSSNMRKTKVAKTTIFNPRKMVGRILGKR